MINHIHLLIILIAVILVAIGTALLLAKKHPAHKAAIITGSTIIASASLWLSYGVLYKIDPKLYALSNQLYFAIVAVVLPIITIIWLKNKK